MHQAFGLPFAELLSNHPEHFRADGFQLEVSAIFQTTLADRFFGATAFERLVNQTAARGQRLLGARRDFAERGLSAIEGNDMAAIGDVDFGVIVATLDHP